MKRALPVIVAILLVGGVAWWVINSDEDQSTETQQTPTNQTTPNTVEENQTEQIQTGQVAVAMENTAFSPKTIKVKKGTTVTWTNRDSVQHDVVSDSDSPNQGLNGPLLSQGETFSFTFNAVGVYKYHCTPHPFMKGTVEVVE